MEPSVSTCRGEVEPTPHSNHLDPSTQLENTSGLETVRIYKSCDSLFRKLLQVDNSDYRGAIVQEYKAFILWTDGFDVAKGNLETILLGSERLRRTVVRLFASIESILQFLECPENALLSSRFSTDVSDSSDDNVSDDDLESDRNGEETNQNATQAAACIPDNPLQQIEELCKEAVQDLKTDIQCLIDITPSLEHPPVHFRSARALSAFGEATGNVSAGMPGSDAYCRLIRDRFPHADTNLTERLGELNWNRYLRLRAQRESATMEDEDGDDALPLSGEEAEEKIEANLGDAVKIPAAPSTFKDSGIGTSAPSTFKDSGLGTSAPSKAPFVPSALSTTSSVARGADVRVPPIPEEGKQGLPFVCVACGCKVRFTERRGWKEHIYGDLLPYTCLVPGCSSSTFGNRPMFWNHIVTVHASDSDDEQQQCPLCKEMQTGRFEFATHIARHLEEISLAALRAAFDTESDVESTTDSYTGDANVDVECTTHADIAHASSTVADDIPGSPDFNFSEFLNIPDGFPDTYITDDGDVLRAPLSSIVDEEGAPSSQVPINQDWWYKASIVERKEEMVDESREDAKRVRKIGACVRCHMYKFKCDEGNPCQKCCRDETTHRLFFQPCSRQEILDAILVRHGNAKFGQQRVSSRKYFWTNLKRRPKTVEMCWVLPGNISRPIQGFKVPCHEFILSHGDITAETWQVAGKVTTIDLPRFACADEKKLYKIVEEMVEQNRAAVEEKIGQSIADPLAQATLNEAFRYAPKSNMIKLALRIRSTAVFSEGWGSIVGTETFGTPEVDNAVDGFGTRPIPPALSHQLDVVFLKMMGRDEQALVKELKKAIFRKIPKPWYEIFLACFVIMSHLKFIRGEAVRFMKCQEQTATEATVSFVTRSMIDEWENSAENLLYHFRYVIRAFLPFQKENMADIRKLGGLDGHGVSYLEKAVSLLDERGWLRERLNNASEKASEDSDDKWIRRLFNPWSSIHRKDPNGVTR